MNFLPTIKKNDFLTTREMLCKQLHAKLCFIHPFLIDKVTGILVDGCSNEQVIELLAKDELLQCRVSLAIDSLDSERSELVGDALFGAVAEVEQELCAQVTGMLLELPLRRLLFLLSEETYLREHVLHARCHYLAYLQGNI